MPASSAAKIRSGCLQRSMCRPKTQLPKARPAMKALSTVLVASRVVPKITVSIRAHTT